LFFFFSKCSRDGTVFSTNRLKYSKIRNGI
jgi:hypothetical protein